MRINWHLAAGLALLVCCSWLRAVEGSELSNQPARGAAPRLFRIVNFNEFKKLFHKHYNSWAEELSRMRLFLARCLESFVSVIKYKQGKQSWYDKISHMSDWTIREFRKTLIKVGRLRGSKKDGKEGAKEPAADRLEADSVQSEAERIAGDIHDEQDVRSKMIEVTRRLDNAQGDESLSELKGEAVRRRRKRDIDASEPQSLDAADLMGGAMAESDKFQHPQIKEGSKRVIDREAGSGRSLASGPNGSGVVTRSMARNKKADTLLVDHRNCLNDPVRQADCGSCYIFVTIASFEYHYCMSTGKKVKFSEQFPLDCRKGFGCGGGNPIPVLEFILEKGLERAEAWPYFGLPKKCPLEKPGMDPDVSGYWRVTGVENRTVDIDRFEDEIVRGPIISYIYIGDSFSEYGGGVHQTDCEEHDDLAHLVLVVGHGRENGHDFWLIRNSYGTDWGEKGYYKISKQSFAKCFVDFIDNGMLIEGDIKFKKNRKYDHDFINELTAKWKKRSAKRTYG